MEWISVKDRLPDSTGFYLVAVDEIVASKYKGVIEVGECYKSVDAKGLFEVLKFHDYVTHWQPLPDPPKE